ncbi:cyclopropane-fatty-acyl-phospholipid synthase family protein [Iodidimonas sp. SYSU 1G8]|uniref:cyclopropane-fatty-acyl-phospholipid synthase family protein n=1 Tax=Iodidimonas sp. SYSU 1G8 TaxID=3133967 RepID=UPI0031FE486C
MNHFMPPEDRPIGRIAARGLGLPKLALGGVGRLLGRVGEAQVFGFAERHLETGTLSIELPSGERRTISGAVPGPAADIQFRDWNALRRLFAEGSVGFADSYVEGHWETADLAALIELAARNRLGTRREVQGHRLSQALQRLAHAMRPNSRKGSRRNIAAHYDLGNAFYTSWLDDTMTYSSGVFPTEDTTLEEAQRHKYRRLLDMIDPKPGERILEIGCGWGGFAEFAARERGVDVTSITISEEQFRFASERVQRAGLGNQVSVQLIDYRDVTGHYDHLVSIEMFEAVGEKYWPTFFGKIAQTVRPGGRAALQVITISEDAYDRYRRRPDFIQTHIFPGGMLPSISAFREQVGKAGLTVLNEAFYADHYARTLRLWRERFEIAADRLRFDGLDDRFRRLWRYYLAYCEGGFRANTIDVMQVGLIRE